MKNKIYLIILLLLACSVAFAGLFRDRDRFNENAGGFWMKGRCVIPKNGLGLQDSSRVFPDLGCIVKNRKGKRRPGKRRANVIIRSLYFGTTSHSGRETWTSFQETTECLNVRRCDSKVFRNAVTLDRGIHVKGAVNCIIGWRSTRTDAHSFISTVGEIPLSEGVSSPWSAEYADFQRSCN